jgi:hypothetical protein
MRELARVGSLPLLRSLRGHIPVRLGGHADLAPVAHTSADDKRRRAGGSERHTLRVHRHVESVRVRHDLSAAKVQ